MSVLECSSLIHRLGRQGLHLDRWDKYLFQTSMYYLYFD
jgi:hypothetical protein